MFTYRITFIIGKLDANANPPAFLPVIFPAFNGEPVTLCEQYCDVTFSEPQTPVSISPLIKVELVTEGSN
jgi:hypothetical protein